MTPVSVDADHLALFAEPIKSDTTAEALRNRLEAAQKAGMDIAADALQKELDRPR